MINSMQETPFLWQRFTHVEVFRLSYDVLQIHLVFQEPSREDHLRVELFIKDFTIKEAVLERTRPSRIAFKPVSLDFLQGRSIYLNEAKNLKKAILEWGETKEQSFSFLPASPSPALPPFPTPTPEEREHFADLFLELISNVLQAEIFLLQERGIPSVEEYDRFFSDLYKDMCILYSAPQEDLETVDDAYTQGQVRYATLFSRSRNTVILRAEGEQGGDGQNSLSIHCHYSDSFHEIGLFLGVSPGSTPAHLVKEIRGNFLRWPASICRESLAMLPNLAGASLLQSNKKEITSRLRGPRGCSHVVDMVMEAARALHELERSGGFEKVNR